MNLRDLVNESVSFEKLSGLVETLFDFDSKDVEVTSKIVMRYRKQFKNCESSRTESEKDLLHRKHYYDYSPENKVFASYCFHKLHSTGISEKSLDYFEGLMILLEEIYTKNPNDFKYEQEPNYRRFKEQTKVLLQSDEGDKIKEIINECGKYFGDRVREFANSPNRQCLIGTGSADNIYLSAQHCISCVYDDWYRAFFLTSH